MGGADRAYACKSQELTGLVYLPTKFIQTFSGSFTLICMHCISVLFQTMFFIGFIIGVAMVILVLIIAIIKVKWGLRVGESNNECRHTAAPSLQLMQV